MEKSNRKIESEIDIHKEEIAVFKPESGEIAKCRSCQILQRRLGICQDIKEKKIQSLDTCWNWYEFSTGYTQHGFIRNGVIFFQFFRYCLIAS